MRNVILHSINQIKNIEEIKECSNCWSEINEHYEVNIFLGNNGMYKYRVYGVFDGTLDTSMILEEGYIHELM